MSKKNKKGQVEVQEIVEEEKVAEVIEEESPKLNPEPKRKSYYNPVAAKARRVALMEAAKKGGYVPKERTPGTGKTEKRVSKTGTNYYYQPWSSLTQEQKDARLLAARTRNADDREMARKYREEHPDTKEVKA